jgi:hypothetical protein
LGEFSPIERLFTLGSGLKIERILGYFFPRYQLGIYFKQKNGLGSILVTFSQTHLVTLFAKPFLNRLRFFKPCSVASHFCAQYAVLAGVARWFIFNQKPQFG